MTNFREIMDEYVKHSDADDMERLTDVLNDMFCKVKEIAPDVYTKYMTKVKLTNKQIPWDREQAECAVRYMRNKDGTTGEHWSYAQTTDVMEKKGYDFNPAEWYYVLNMVYSDHYAAEMQIDAYVKYAHDIIEDIDAPKNATKRTYIAKYY